MHFPLLLAVDVCGRLNLSHCCFVLGNVCSVTKTKYFILNDQNVCDLETIETHHQTRVYYTFLHVAEDTQTRPD